ncbi:alpha-E domain-containing protein [Spongiibacter taiwanensis]|uniref:alpha-E domain-containing protein n=1 Tax=Spongiibacter taiwanensis TaxID=1748242 RepID=UPI00203519A4|nr:alpha-E domain-containing protein [Spongiibacter taiwanensis]USA44069.1 alpha-E domain-containing protein [Spongiibacter taiwanensis]
MMLSRVAERVYWFARYLERVESMARLINVYTSLLFDLPKDTGISWHNLVIASGSHHEYERRFSVKDEKRVVRFLLEDTSNLGSLMSSLRMVRENIRTTRDVLPAESWELVNEFQIFVSENMQQGLNRRHRTEFLGDIVKTCQQINGLIYDTMRRDEAWHFLVLGRSLETADMTLRTLEAGARMSGDCIEHDSVHVTDAVWSSVLGTLNAIMPFRRTMKVSLNGEDSARFLLEDTLFPRAVTACLLDMRASAAMLPRGLAVGKAVDGLIKQVEKGDGYEDVLVALPAHIDELQRQLGGLHNVINETWFTPG